MTPDELQKIELLVEAALHSVDNIRATKRVQRAAMSRFDFRNYTLRDAREDADAAARRLREAWEIIDPRAKK